MNENDRYKILFESVEIGPVTAKNRFYQVPHCNGGGYRDPSAVAEMRRIKAEGGWGVVFTEQVELHHSSEITPYIELRLWEDDDIPMITKMAEGIHKHDALAGIELAYPGINGPNLYTREVPMAPTPLPIRSYTNDPVSARVMTKRDIRDLRRWHRDACLRTKTADYDLICLYGAHGFGVIQHFLSPLTNQRSDEYGGSLKNRSRLMSELISECRDAVGDRCAIAVRLSLDEQTDGLGFTNTELRELVAMHADLPDLWDFAHGSWEDCSSSSRFSEESSQTDLVAGIRQLTSKPVVGVGRFTSPDTMVKQIKDGVLDFIGCARPSIADPFLPNKIKQDKVDEIRECIGCNICITGDMTMSLSRCTQNPTFMEEWRRGWHPEIFANKGGSDSVLIVGSGPAGLEAARVLGERGYSVVIAEAKQEIGGRVQRERSLPGLSAWGRVADYRKYQIERMANVDIYLDSLLDADQVLSYGFNHVAVATGAHWRRDGVARYHVKPLPIESNARVYTPDDIMEDNIPSGKVVVYDDDHYYMGGVLSELLCSYAGHVTLVTPSANVSDWTVNTLEQYTIHSRLASLGVKIVLNRAVSEIFSDGIDTVCRYTGDKEHDQCDAVVLVTAQRSEDKLWQELRSRESEWADAGIQSIQVIGDANAPAPIAWATFAGHRYARELDMDKSITDMPFRRDQLLN
ncbi:MAG: FAD-dependent oxidoreductase [Gammaproteobacteria bacterium]|nr:FAD-dependent oxidoreductase [Gammaproteobacteria bacterium]MCY4218387.1 FAD-dependent oxidoreductase [Gammaproteobacteria bacterium]MCY4275561.1 FAD-dependent oxidoreductase [Gammaproteobacteria bacterium]